MKRRRWLQWTTSVALATVLTGCTLTSSPNSTDAPQNEPACDNKRFSLSAEHYADVGEPGDANGSERPFVVVLDEQHASRVGQVEIAIMLNRLYHDAGLRELALEGSVVEEPPPDLSWFTSRPDASIRTAVALRMLRQGEVNGAEFAAMVLPDFRLRPIEHDTEYQTTLSDAATRSFTGYLVAIAATTMTSDAAVRANSLLEQDKYEQAIRYIVSQDPWTNQRYQLLKQTSTVVSTEEMRNLAAELRTKAQEVGADVTGYEADLQAAETFFDTAARRSETMVENTAGLVKADDCALVAMNIGAAHTSEVTDFLGQQEMSYAVVSPSSLSSLSSPSSFSDNGSLSAEAYNRKLNNQSVDPAGALGALLDGRRKPRPSTQNEWFKTKAELSYATVAIARAAHGGGEAPFGLDQEKLGLGGAGYEPGIAIDLSTIRVVPSGGAEEARNDVIFKVTLRKENVDLWVRAGVVAEPVELSDNPRTLEKALMRTLDSLKNERPGKDPKPSDRPKVAAITSDVRVAVAKTQKELTVVTLI